MMKTFILDKVIRMNSQIYLVRIIKSFIFDEIDNRVSYSLNISKKETIHKQKQNIRVLLEHVVII